MHIRKGPMPHLLPRRANCSSTRTQSGRWALACSSRHTNKFRLSPRSERPVTVIPFCRTLDRTRWLFVLSRCWVTMYRFCHHHLTSRLFLWLWLTGLANLKKKRCFEGERSGKRGPMLLWKVGPCDSSMDEGGPDPALHRKHGSTRRGLFRSHTHHRWRNGCSERIVTATR